MKLKEADIHKIRNYLKPVIFKSQAGKNDIMISSGLTDDEREVLEYIEYELTEPEKIVWKYCLEGFSLKEIAGKLNKTPARITQLKKQIEKKINRYLE